MIPMPVDPASPSHLTARQSTILIAAGIILWFAAALLLQALNTANLLGGTGSMIVYALVIPGTLPFVLLLARIAGLSAPQIVPGYALATLAALFCDGTAVAFWPALYGANDLQVRLAAGAVIWGAAVGLALAFGLARSRTR
jgi:hypothetical protein